MNKTQVIEFKLPIDDIDQPEDLKKQLQEYSKEPKGFMLLSGKNGTGKSFAAKAVMDSCRLDMRISANPQFDSPMTKMISQSQLNILWNNTLNKWGDTNYLLNQIIYTKMFVLDDLGVRTPTEAFMDFLYAIVDERYTNRENLGTILTTNLNAADMRSKFGDAFVSRVASGKCFRIDGKDRRQTSI